jgi:hypothetical protein
MANKVLSGNLSYFVLCRLRPIHAAMIVLCQGFIRLVFNFSDFPHSKYEKHIGWVLVAGFFLNFVLTVLFPKFLTRQLRYADFPDNAVKWGKKS